MATEQTQCSGFLGSMIKNSPHRKSTTPASRPYDGLGIENCGEKKHLSLDIVLKTGTIFDRVAPATGKNSLSAYQ